MQKPADNENWIFLKNYKFSEKNLLGNGAYAEVFLGIEIDSNKKVAIKRILKKKIDFEPKLVAGMKTEVDIMKSKEISHNHVLQLMHFEESKIYYYLVIELCKNDLGKVIKGMKQLQLGKNAAYNFPTPKLCIPEEIAGLFFVQMMLGLQNLHSRKVLHRDLKPENLLMTTNPFDQGGPQPNFDGCVLKLADFGFSRQLDTGAVLAQTVCGTPLYMSPELMNQTKYGPKSDVWSCGCILYEMLTGVPPFIAPSNFLGQKISSEQVNYPPYISPEAHKCLYSMLRKNPGNRADLE